MNLVFKDSHVEIWCHSLDLLGVTTCLFAFGQIQQRRLKLARALPLASFWIYAASMV